MAFKPSAAAGQSDADGVTRRDFVNGTLATAGALAAGCAPPDRTAEAWDGFGGVGDYRRSHGNSHAMLTAGHRVRDGGFDDPVAPSADEESYDLVVVGGGISGLSAALYFRADHPKGRCLVLDNHEVFGGEAKRNEFDVQGHLLTGPQGANSFPVPAAPGARGYDTYVRIGMPRTFDYVAPAGAAAGLEFCRDNFEFQYWKDRSESFGWLFDPTGPSRAWLHNIWRDELARAPLAPEVRADLLKWRSTVVPNGGEPGDEGFRRWLDSMTYQHLIEQVMGLSPEVTRYAHPILASACSGMGCDVTSAFAAYQIAMPGFRDQRTLAELLKPEQHSFPGGNDVFTRHFIKTLVPEAIRGDLTLDDIMNEKIRFSALDRRGRPVRIRLGSTVVRVAHEGPDAGVRLAYLHKGEVRTVKARGVVMAGGSWITRHVVRDLPEAHRDAYQAFNRTPLLVANVAVRNWRFLAGLRLTACRWFEGFGYVCNIRQPMAVGRDRAPLDPDKPAVVTFYVPFFYPGTGSIHDQAARGRMELLSTSYAGFERKIRDQMALLFGPSGFRQEDIAGIILNRWGHAYLCPQPGFYFGSGGKAPARNVIRTPHGRIAFAHSELNGQQNWIAAADEGRRAAGQAMAAL